MSHVAKASVTRAAKRPAFPASPALEALIAGYLAAHAETERLREARGPIQAAFKAIDDRCRPADAALREAMDAVPIPALIQAPKSAPATIAVVLEYADGTTRREPLDASAFYTLAGQDSIREHYKDDPTAQEAALSAYEHWQHARMMAHAAVYSAARGPDWQAADREATKSLRPVREAAKREAAAFRALATFQPETPEDAVALAAFLLKDQLAAKISADGNVSRIDVTEPYHPQDTTNLNVLSRALSLLFRGVIDATNATPALSGPDAVREYMDRSGVAIAQEILNRHGQGASSADATALALVAEYEGMGGKIALKADGDVYFLKNSNGSAPLRAAAVATALCEPTLERVLRRVLRVTGRVEPGTVDEDAIANAPDYARGPQACHA